MKHEFKTISQVQGELWGGPRLGLLTIAEKQPELAISYGQTAAWPRCDQKRALSPLTEAEAETHSQT